MILKTIKKISNCFLVKNIKNMIGNFINSQISYNKMYFKTILIKLEILTVKNTNFILWMNAKK